MTQKEVKYKDCQRKRIVLWSNRGQLKLELENAMKIRAALPPLTQDTTVDAQGQSFHRSGAVARMLRMPVATLRVWERRYGVTKPSLSPSGQRQYSTDDVRRLTLMRQLTDLGHAIGSLAGLDMAQLQRVASTHAQALTAPQVSDRPRADQAPPARAWRLAVIGVALGKRLQRPALLRQIGRPVVLLGPFDDAAHASAELQGSPVDAVVIYEPGLQEGWAASIDEAAPALVGVPKAVLYSFASDAACDALAAAGAVLLRDPQPDVVVAQWLRSASLVAQAPLPEAGLPTRWPGAVPPRRWDDAALADFAGLLTTIACECPRHVAQLLMQLSHFEAYSAECESRSPGDAALHAYLHQVAATSRAKFEAALEQVALHEGLMLPSSLRRENVAEVPSEY